MINFLKKLFRPGRYSLKLTMLYVILFGIALAVLLFITIKFGANAFIENVYMSDESCLEREENNLKSLQNYIDEKRLTSENQAELLKWAEGNRDLFFMIYTIDNQLVFESDPNKPTTPPDGSETEGADSGDDSSDTNDQEGEGSDDGAQTPEGEGDAGSGTADPNAPDDNKFPGLITVRKPTREEKIDYAERNGAKHITMSDGDVMMVYMADFSEYSYYDLANVASLIVAMIGLVLVIMFYFHRLTKRIIVLGNEVNAVAGGNMDHYIKQDGKDEIGMLSANVENMRCTMLQTLENERAAMDANTELITAMSHDIRTPLTVLLGYIDVMKLNAAGGVMREYIDASEKTALRLKKMSDDMFNYFLVFGSGGTEVSMQEYDAVTLVEQLLVEHMLLMREQGYDLRYNFEDEFSQDVRDARVVTDAPNLMRIAENLFSNILKYADKSAPVLISVVSDEGKLLLTFENKIDKTVEKVKSSGIGLKTCKKIAELIKADFRIETTDERFAVYVGLEKLSKPISQDGADQNDKL